MLDFIPTAMVWLLGIVASTVLSVVLTLWQSDNLLFWLAKWFPTRNPENKRFCGIWKTYYVVEDYVDGADETKIVHLRVRGIGKHLIGRSIETDESYDLKGRIANHKFVSGTFTDRRAGVDDRREGAFQVAYLATTQSPSNLDSGPIEITVSGRWIGYSLTEPDLIRRGAWYWHHIGA